MKSGWQKKTLEEVSIAFGRGKSKHRPRNDPALFEGKYPFIQTGDIRNANHLITEYSQTYNEAGLAQSKLWPKGTLCITIAANIAETGILDFEACFPDSVIGVVTNPEEAEVGFVEYLLQSLKLHIQSKGKGSAQANINLGTFENERFPFPPVPEQQRIVAILDEAFDGIATAKAKAEKNLQNARELFESHLQDIFAQRGDEWGEAPLSELCDIKHGFAFDGAEFSSDVPEGNPLVITPGNFTEDGRLLFNEKNTKRFSGKAPVGFRFDVGDLVVVMTDLSSKMKILGKPAFVETKDVLHNQRIGRVVFFSAAVAKRLVYYFMMSEGFLKNIKGSATGTMVKHTAPTRILSQKIPFPRDQKHQLAVVAKLDALREETQRLASIYQRKLTALDELKKSILHQAFNGDL